MALLNWLLGKDSSTPASATSNAPSPLEQALPFPTQMKRHLHDFIVEVKRNSSELPQEAYSRLRHTEDSMNKLLGYIEDKNLRLLPEHSFIIEAIITDYLPTTVSTFLNLDTDDRHEGSKMSNDIISNCNILHLSVLDIEDKIHEQVITEANIQKRFIEQKLTPVN